MTRDEFKANLQFKILFNGFEETIGNIPLTHANWIAVDNMGHVWLYQYEPKIEFDSDDDDLSNNSPYSTQDIPY